jgi:flagellar motor switch protein FliM
MLEHIHRVPVTVQVKLAKIMLPFSEVMSLEAGDVVMLNKKVSETVDILVDDRTLFRGCPAQSGGHYAVVIV